MGKSFKGQWLQAVPDSGQLFCCGPQGPPEPLLGVPPALTIGSSLCCQGEASQHPATCGCVCNSQGVLYLPGAVSVGLGFQDSSFPHVFTCSALCSQGKPHFWTLGVPGPCALPSQPGVGSLPTCSCPTSRSCPRWAQGLVSLRATGREVFDWILDQGYYSERDTSNVVRQVLEAVAYLHSLKIVHRNLKVRPAIRSEGLLAASLRLGWAVPWDHGLVSEGFMLSSYAHPHAIPCRSSWRTWFTTTG